MLADSSSCYVDLSNFKFFHPTPNRICFSLRVQLLEMVLEEDWKKPRFAQPNFGDAIFGLSWLRISDFHWNHQILWLSALLLFWEASHIRYMNLFIYIYMFFLIYACSILLCFQTFFWYQFSWGSKFSSIRNKHRWTAWNFLIEPDGDLPGAEMKKNLTDLTLGAF